MHLVSCLQMEVDIFAKTDKLELPLSGPLSVSYMSSRLELGVSDFAPVKLLLPEVIQYLLRICRHENHNRRDQGSYIINKPTFPMLSS